MRKSIVQLAVLMSFAILGCSTDGAGNEDGSVRSRQNDALKDPFSYGPENHSLKKPPQEPGPFKEDTAKSDWDRFWNP